ncbi:hypothetical protein V8G54_033071 [Vigna mungo]|uniref:Transposase MuDR plant domain-containing protein n=1 Tax=Vigna mungo TaxID=3915 RepID=A0AAQ3MNC3_VIGMU
MQANGASEQDLEPRQRNPFESKLHAGESLKIAKGNSSVPDGLGSRLDRVLGQRIHHWHEPHQIRTLGVVIEKLLHSQQQRQLTTGRRRTVVATTTTEAQRRRRLHDDEDVGSIDEAEARGGNNGPRGKCSGNGNGPRGRRSNNDLKKDEEQLLHKEEEGKRKKEEEWRRKQKNKSRFDRLLCLGLPLNRGNRRFQKRCVKRKCVEQGRRFVQRWALTIPVEIMERKGFVKDNFEGKGLEAVFLRSKKGGKVVFHHGGKFGNDGSFRYHGGQTTTLLIHTDRWSYFEILGILKEMGYRNVKELWYSLSGRVLEDRSNACGEVSIALLNGSSHLFVVHMVSQPDYILELQYDVGEHGEDVISGQEGQVGCQESEVGCGLWEDVVGGEENVEEDDGQYGEVDGGEEAQVGGQEGHDVVGGGKNVKEDGGQYGEADGGEEGEVGCGLGKNVVAGEENVEEDGGQYGEEAQVGGEDVVGGEENVEEDGGQYGEGDGGEEGEVDDKEGQVGCGLEDVVADEENIEEDGGQYGEADGEDDLVDVVVHADEEVEEEDVEIGTGSASRRSKLHAQARGLSNNEWESDKCGSIDESDDDSRNETPRYGDFGVFSKPVNMKEYKWELGTYLPKKNDFIDAIMTYGIHNGRKLKISKNDKRRICVKCCGSQGKCPWYASDKLEKTMKANPDINLKNLHSKFSKNGILVCLSLQQPRQKLWLPPTLMVVSNCDMKDLKVKVSGRPSCDTLVNNISEAFNSVIVDARGKPIITMLEEIHSYLMKRWASNRQKIIKYEGVICPKIQKRLQKELQKTQYWIPNGFSQGSPCCHALTAMRFQNMNPEHFIPNWFRTSTYEETYNPIIFPVNEPELWQRTSYPHIFPPPNRVLPGRPRKKRRLESWEQMRDDTQLGQAGIPKRCGICRQLGHRRTNCHQASQHQHHQAIANPIEGSEQQDHQPTPHPNQASQQEDHQPTPHATQGSQITRDDTSTTV